MTKEGRLGLQKTTLVDYPGEVASTLFTFGCNMCCPYCHNADLVAGIIPATFLSEKDIFKFLTKRCSTLGGVCITGGEPLLFPNIEHLIDKIHKLNLKVKLDTNGTLPQKLTKITPDFIAMDIKSSLNRYQELGFNHPQAIKRLSQSIKWIIQSKIPHEFRTTVVPQLVGEKEIHSIIPLIQGCDQYVLTKFNPKFTLDPTWKKKEGYSDKKMIELADITRKAGIKTTLRGVSQN